MAAKTKIEPMLVREWTIPGGATLGSSVRARGIMLEMRARLPLATRKMIDIVAGMLVLRVPETSAKAFESAAEIITRALDGIETMPVIPREIEDILSITSTQRHRWLGDGRLKSAGTRTVKLRGRARKITFHVFDPRHVEDILDRDLVDTWREQDAETAAENRRRAAWKAKLARASKAEAAPVAKPGLSEDASPGLVGWAAFERDGLLR